MSDRARPSEGDARGRDDDRYDRCVARSARGVAIAREGRIGSPGPPAPARSIRPIHTGPHTTAFAL